MQSTWRPTYQPLGDQGVLISYENRIDPKITEEARLLAEALGRSSPPWLRDVVFSYRCVLAIYDLHNIRFLEVMEFIANLEVHIASREAVRPDLYEIPTLYGGHDGPDLNRVSEITGYSQADVIERFSSTVFAIHFLGFLCAQPYLGALPEDLHVPRQLSPRLYMPAGSVGIGGAQASLITVDQPSGHNFIGRTNLSLYDPMRIPPPCLKAGDQILFPRISRDQIDRFKGKLPVRKGYSEC